MVIAQILQICSIPIELLALVLSVILQNIVLCTTLIVFIGLLSLLSQTSGNLFVLFVNTYNSGIGIFINTYTGKLTLLYNIFVRPFLPIYNAWVWFTGKVLLHVIVPSFQVDIEILPELAQNMQLLGAAVVTSLHTWTTRLFDCMWFDAQIPEMDCIGNTNYMSIDLMTPGVFVREVVLNFNALIEVGCSASVLPLNVLMYPLLDFNFYSFLHGAVNTILHPIALTLHTYQRCAYGNAQSFSQVEKTVMCVPDFEAWISMGRSSSAALGKLIDNWLNMVLVLVERAVQLSIPTCSQTSVISARWNDASRLLNVESGNNRIIQVVGLTDSLYAITDGISTVYESMLNGGETTVAVGHWPFPIEVRHGVAAVQFSDIFDGDEIADGRTGLLGCRCYDSAEGAQIWCASVPYLVSAGDNETVYNSSTIHQIRFADAGATRHMTCATSRLKVSSLRFSRKRASVSRGNGVDAYYNDYFDTLGRSGVKETESFTADASIYLTPLCSLANQARRLDCVPDTQTCFPYCMGLHVAGQSANNITMYPARRWTDKITLAQTDCVIDVESTKECLAGIDNTEINGPFQLYNLAACNFLPESCIDNNLLETSVPRSLLTASLDERIFSGPTVRQAQQPIVMAGDFMMSVDTVGEVVIVSRLYDLRNGDYSLQKEALNVESTEVSVRVHTYDTGEECRVADAECYRAALQANHVVLPPPVRLETAISYPVAASEWALHWADNPDNGVLALPLAYCKGDSTFGAVVESMFGRPRVWTLKTTRVSVDTDRRVHFMEIPDWLSISTPCNQEAHVKVVDLEYLNADNILVTVLRASPRNYDWTTGWVCESCHFSYTFFFLHPNLHECTDPDDTENNFYSCWRDETQGMWPSRDTPSSGLYATLCPALRRMPQVGAAGAELAKAGWNLLGIILDLVTVLPAAAASGGVHQLFQERVSRPTFHAVLDSSGSRIVDFEPILINLDKFAFYVSHFIVKVTLLFKDRPGYNEVQPLAVGTAKVLQHMDAVLPLDTGLLSILEGIKKIPTWRAASAGSSPLTNSGVPSPPLLTRMKNLFASGTSAMKYNTRLVRKMAIRILKRDNAGLLDIKNLLSAELYETSGDFTDTLLGAVRAQCDGLSNILGTTNPLARLVRHGCHLYPDGIEGVSNVAKIMFVEYPRTDCACRLSQGDKPIEVISRVCLDQTLPVEWQAIYKFSRSDAIDDNGRINFCYVIMDDTNNRLEASFDRLFSRMQRFTSAFESSLDYLLKAIPLFSEDAGECSNFLQSPYVVSIIPQPVDYFYGCVHTFDCRSRCLDSFTAFETALARFEAKPTFQTEETLELESRFFTFDDSDSLSHLAPFEIFALLELSKEACVEICQQDHSLNRCVAVAGLDGDNLQSAHYCLPADYQLSVFQYQLPKIHDAQLVQWTLDQVHFLSAEYTTSPTLVILQREREECIFRNDRWFGCAARIAISTSEIVPSQIILTESFYPTAPHDPSRDVLEFIDDIWVRTSTQENSAYIFVRGRKQTPNDSGNYAATEVCRRLIVASTPQSAAEIIAIAETMQSCSPNEETYLFSTTHIVLCLGQNCLRVARVPRSDAITAPVQIFSINWDTFQWTLDKEYSSASSLAKVLALHPDTSLYRTQANRAAINRKHASLIAHESTNGIDVLVSGRRREHSGWVQAVRVTLSSESGLAKATQHASTKRTETVSVEFECGIENCIGCANSLDPTSTVDLQAKCFAAAQCGVARCAGTLVNMRKPLCNVGKVFAGGIDFYRIGVHSAWIVLSRNIIMIVELTHERRERYNIDFVDEILMAGVCNTKDRLAESVATVTSIIGGIGYLQDVAIPDQLGISSQIDSRFHAQHIMLTTAVTSAITNIFLFPLYNIIIMHKTTACRFNDMFLFVTEAADLPIKFEIGNQKLEAASNAAVGMCLTKSIEATMREYGHATGFKSLKGNVGDIISQAVDLRVKLKLEHFKHSMDGSLTYTMGLLAGIIDVVAVSDWYHCRLPNAAIDYSQCVCGDEFTEVSHQRKTETADQQAFWCSGPLLLTDFNGDDFLVWNPYSLHELLQVNLDEYLTCVLSGRPECVIPPDEAAQTFKRQGATILQVITRCRSNYLAKTWDSGAIILGMYDIDTWSQPRLLSRVENLADLSYARLRQRLRILSTHVKPFALPLKTHQCLQSASLVNNWNHACMEENVRFGRGFVSIDSFYMYEPPGGSTSFQVRDACRSFSGHVEAFGSNGAAINPSMQTLSTVDVRMQSVTQLHYIKHASTEDRLEEATTQLSQLHSEIKQEIDELGEIDTDKISASAWSVEGDELHQLVDCVVMGPFAAADAESSFEMTNNQRLRVEQYHRGSPSSREFSVGRQTQGSAMRQKIVAAVQAKVSASTVSSVIEPAQQQLRKLKAFFRREIVAKDDTPAIPINFLCACSNGERSVACCVENTNIQSLADIDFPALRVLEDVWDLSQDVASLMFDAALEDEVWQKLWTESTFSQSIPLTNEERAEMVHAQLFDTTNTVHHYDESDLRPPTTTPLWTQCASLLSASFFTLPMLNGEVDADVIYDPTSEGTDEYLHGMERVVQKILLRAERDSPVYWSHIHRYVASDSVWCEDSTETVQAMPKSNVSIPTSFMQANIDKDLVQGPFVQDVPMPGSMVCVCGWAHANGTCSPKPLDPDVLSCDLAVTDDTLKRRWNSLCLRGWYTSRSDLFLVKQVLYQTETTWHADCSLGEAALHWGLMDTSDLEEWYTGNHQGNISLHELASRGPSGLRLGLLGNGDNSLRDYLRGQKHIDREQSADNFAYEHTVAQPVCESNLNEMLTNDLSTYFKDVFFPMAHTVSEAPASAACSRWIIEHAIYTTTARIRGDNDPRVIILRQRTATWHLRCKTQLQQLGICLLRGVFEIEPPNSNSDAHCPFSLELLYQYSICSELFYVTENCIVMCDGGLYDPCACATDSCIGYIFNPLICNSMLDPRQFADFSDNKLGSLHAATILPSAERTENIKTPDYNFQLGEHDFAAIIADLVADRQEAEFISNQEQSPPRAFCDDLHDYWDSSAQHPVGYHPTCACKRQDTNMRGFDGWMSAGVDEAWAIDPIRLRNMTKYSSMFGFSHLTCSADVYGTRGYPLNPFYLQTKWNPRTSADPTVPPLDQIVPDNVESMWYTGPNSNQRADETPLRQQHAHFLHTVGLVRDWLRWDDDQEAANSDWPSWDSTAFDDYGLPESTEELAETSCGPPPLRHCTVDEDCNSQISMKCLKNTAFSDTTGICMHEDTCFQHAHCGDSQMCSGEGRCVEPKLYFKNFENDEAAVRLYGKNSSQCRVDNYGLSEFQNIPTFARDNGVCSYRDWFHFIESTDGVDAVSNRRVVGDREVAFTDARGRSTLRNQAIMKQFPHSCDRSYEHTEYFTCNEFAASIDGVSRDGNDIVRSTRTWSRDDADTVAFCDMPSRAKEVTGFLNPYVYRLTDRAEIDTLKHVPDTVRLCSDFNVCIPKPFVIDGETIEPRYGEQSRRVLTVTLNEHGYPLDFSTVSRSYLHIDTQRCKGPGYLATVSGVTEYCVVDRFTSPLLQFLFVEDSANPMPMFSPTRASALESKFTGLLSHCPHAFDGQYERFVEFYTVLSKPYRPSEAENVVKHANLLLLEIFGRKRGFSELSEYLLHQKCASNLLVELERQRSLREPLSPYTFFTGTQKPTPGLSLYLFRGHAVMYTPFLWMWQCVITSDSTQGGAPTDWLERLTSSEITESVNCKNYEYSSTKDLSVADRLRTSRYFFTQLEGTDFDVDLRPEIRAVVTQAVEILNLPWMPNIACLTLHVDDKSDPQIAPECHLLENQHSSCYTKYGRDMTSKLNSSDSDAIEESLYYMVQQVIYGGKSAFTMSQHIQEGIVSRSEDLTRLVEHDALFVPSITLPKLDQNVRAMLERDSPTSLELPEFDVEASQIFIDETDPETNEKVQYAIQIEKACSDNFSPAEPVNPIPQNKHDVSYQFSEGEFRKIDPDIPLPVQIQATLQSYDLEHLTTQIDFTQKQTTLLTLLFVRIFAYHTNSFAAEALHSVLDPVPQYGVSEFWNAKRFNDEVNLARQYDFQIASKTEKCTENDNPTLTDITNTHHVKLQECHEEMQTTIAWKVPSEEELLVPVAADLLLNGFFASFHTTDTSAKFLDNLLSDSMYVQTPNVCYLDLLTEKIRIMNPWWAGDYDFTSGCDSEAVGDDWTLLLRGIDSSCTTPCPTGFENTTRNEMPPRCYTQDKELLPRQSLSHQPLCSRVMSQSSFVCDRVAYGAFGGFQGETSKDLHVDETDVAVLDGIWSSGNTLLRTPASNSGRLQTLRVLPTDIAGHLLQFSLRDGRLSARRMFLADTPQLNSVQVTSWLSSIENFWEFQNSQSHARPWLHTQQSQSWVCPLLWYASYSDHVPRFAARVPDARRNRARFTHITGDYEFAHPTVVSSTRIENGDFNSLLHGGRFMSATALCRDNTLTTCKGLSQLQEEVRRVRSSLPEIVRIVGSSEPCNLIFDWPHLKSTLADRSISYGDSEQPQPGTCFALDRLPAFAAQQTKRTSIPSSHAGAHSADGVCRMGRLLRVGDMPSNGRIQHCTRNETHVTCVTATHGHRNSTTFPLSQSANADLRNATKHTRCSACQSHRGAEFVTPYGHRHMFAGSAGSAGGAGSAGSAGSAKQQMSTGVQFKLDTARVVAARLRRELCPTAQREPCPALYSALPQEAWARDVFLRFLLTNASQPGVATDIVDDFDFWGRPWVFCDQSEDRRGEPGSCNGSISKDAWIDPKRRPGECLAAIKLASKNKSEPISFCGLDPVTQKICSKIATWNDAARRILCEARGLPECHDSAFFYTPTTFSPANREFSWQSVRTYYDGVSPGSCPAEVVTEAADTQLYNKCAALPFQALYEIVQATRSIAGRLLEMSYFTAKLISQVAMNLVAAVLGDEGLMARSMQNLNVAFELFLFSVSKIIETITDLVFKIIFDYGLGKALIELVQEVCNAITFIYINIIRNYACLLISFFATIVEGIAHAISQIPLVDLTSTTDPMFGFAKDVRNVAFCHDEDPLNCQSLDALLANGELQPDPPILIVPTRCWSTYITFFGDSRSLSCSPQDVCVTSIGASTTTLCGQCAEVTGVDRFGCEHSTKQCSCHVLRYEQTTCFSNSDCIGNPNCRYLDSDLQPSFGSVPCQQCLGQHYCFLPPDSAAGYCACGLSEITPAECTADNFGNAVWPSLNNLCLFQPDESASRTLSYSATFSDLLVTPCVSVSFANTFCMLVNDEERGSQYFVVALEQVVTFRRRLLSINNTASISDNTTHNALCRDAQQSDALPHTRHTCNSALAKSAETIQLLGLDMRACAFCSWEDVLHTMKTQPMASTLLLAQPRKWALVLSRHSEFLRPVQSIVQFWEVARYDMKSLTEQRFPRNYSLLGALINKAIDFPVPKISQRRLLSSENQAAQTKTEFENMQTLHHSYANQFSVAFEYNYPMLSNSQTKIWMEQWPPTYATTSGDSCRPLEKLIEYAQVASESAAAAFETPSATPIERLSDAWPVLTSAPYAEQSSSTSDDWIIAAVVRAIRSFFTAINVDVQVLSDLVYTLVKEVEHNFECDLIAVQTCSAWRVRLLPGFFVIAIYFSVGFFVCQSFGITFVAFMMAPLFTWMVLYICYGYSLMCIPLVPTCLFDDFSMTVQQFLPNIIVIPQSMIHDRPECVRQDSSFLKNATLRAYSASCVISCEEAPFLYLDWRSVAAWAFAEVQIEQYAIDNLRYLPFIHQQKTKEILVFKQQQLASLDESLLTGNRFCAVITSYKIIPYIFVVLCCMFGILVISRISLRLVYSWVVLVGSVFISIFTE